MELRFTPEEVAFRDEVRRFVRGEIPEGIRRKTAEGRPFTKDDIVTTHRILNARGWATPHWPKEWGGLGWSAAQRFIFDEELQRSGAPSALPFNVHMVGPVLIAFGSEAQKRRFLPQTANLDIWWCQGFSEPGAGSDLAGLTTRAVRRGERYVLNGQKAWTTLGQYADWMFVLARTDPEAKKQQGISFLLLDMTTPGITVRPTITIDGGHEVNEVFFDDVEVPVENLVGEENRGWDCAKFLLSNERTNIARIGMSKERIDRAKRLARETPCGDGTLWDDLDFRKRLARIEVELKALEITQMRVIAARRQNSDRPDPSSSILKIRGSEIQQATTEVLKDVAGPYAVLPADLGAPGNEPGIGPASAGALTGAYLNYRKVSIYGGSNEIQRNIIAKAFLGL